MKKQTRYNSVAEVVRDLSEDRAFADDFAKRLAGRRLIKALAVLRARAGLSQQELAEKLDCTQSKISKMESSDDADIRFGDLIDYTAAVGCKMHLFLVPKGLKIADEVNVHASVIKRLLDKMVHLAGSDGVMTEAVANFLEEAASNLIGIVRKAAAALPALSDGPSLALQVEALDVEAECLPKMIAQ